MAATIYDVAARAGVGIGTVSRALNNSPKIKPETKARVLQAVKDLEYSPHPLAQRLARRKTGLIAVIMPFYTGHFYQELLRGIQHSLSKYEYDLILYYIDKPSKLNVYFDRTIQEKRCDGVLLISMSLSDTYMTKYSAGSIPLVLVDRAHELVDCILVKNEEGAVAATEYLLSLGHRRIAMITGHGKSEPAIQRRSGYERVLRAASVDIDADLYVSADMLGEDKIFQLNDGFNEQVGQVAMERLLRLGSRRPTAVFASSDIQALGAMKAVGSAGLKIPRDMAIVGFDDIELASYLSLTTMKQPMFEMGQLAIERIIQKIENRDTAVRQLRLDTRLVERGSTRANSEAARWSQVIAGIG